MSKEPEKKAEHKGPPSEPMPATGCVVCGQVGGELSALPDTDAGAGARWHKACEAAHPHVITKVKARA